MSLLGVNRENRDRGDIALSGSCCIGGQPEVNCMFSCSLMF